MDHGTFFEKALDEAKSGVMSGDGGPFGAVIVNEKTNKVVCTAHNMVLSTKDPTSHAEISCIREACKILNTFDLSGHIMFSTCEPCPMCFGAIHWARLSKCHYASLSKEAADAGFSDKEIYDAIRNPTSETCLMNHCPIPKAAGLFQLKYNMY